VLKGFLIDFKCDVADIEVDIKDDDGKTISRSLHFSRWQRYYYFTCLMLLCSNSSSCVVWRTDRPNAFDESLHLPINALEDITLANIAYENAFTSDHIPTIPHFEILNSSTQIYCTGKSSWVETCAMYAVCALFRMLRMGVDSRRTYCSIDLRASI
jgi:hypothetical protein